MIYLHDALNQRQENPQSNETGSFGFALTLLTIIGTIFYAVFSYFQNESIEVHSYSLVCGLITIGFILILGLVFYILIKGHSMEEKEPKKTFQTNLASYIYLYTFKIFTVLLIWILWSFWISYREIMIPNLINGIFLIFIIIGVIIIFDKPNRPFTKRIIKDKPNLIYFLFLLILGFVIWLSLFPLVLDSPLKGHVTIDMESIYYMNDTQIPIFIQVTGPDTGLSIKLFKEDSNNLSEIAFIPYLEPENNFKTTSNNNLLGISLGSGKYSFFINTTDLTPGYYELVCIRPKYEKTYNAKGFYLLNNSYRS